ncbi:exported hypothetical protein [Vibrio chagasii]|nr:exported hypothetical protein [Vibrio chagasii]
MVLKIMSLKKSILAVIVATTISACGGGSGGNNDNDVTSPPGPVLPEVGNPNTSEEVMTNISKQFNIDPFVVEAVCENPSFTCTYSELSDGNSHSVVSYNGWYRLEQITGKESEFIHANKVFANPSLFKHASATEMIMVVTLQDGTKVSVMDAEGLDLTTTEGHQHFLVQATDKLANQDYIEKIDAAFNADVPVSAIAYDMKVDAEYVTGASMYFYSRKHQLSEAELHSLTSFWNLVAVVNEDTIIQWGDYIPCGEGECGTDGEFEQDAPTIAVVDQIVEMTGFDAEKVNHMCSVYSCEAGVEQFTVSHDNWIVHPIKNEIHFTTETVKPVNYQYYIGSKVESSYPREEVVVQASQGSVYFDYINVTSSFVDHKNGTADIALHGSFAIPDYYTDNVAKWNVSVLYAQVYLRNENVARIFELPVAGLMPEIGKHQTETENTASKTIYEMIDFLK